MVTTRKGVKKAFCSIRQNYAAIAILMNYFYVNLILIVIHKQERRRKGKGNE